MKVTNLRRLKSRFNLSRDTSSPINRSMGAPPFAKNLLIITENLVHILVSIASFFISCELSVALCRWCLLLQEVANIHFDTFHS